MLQKQTIHLLVLLYTLLGVIGRGSLYAYLTVRLFKFKQSQHQKQGTGGECKN